MRPAYSLLVLPVIIAASSPALAAPSDPDHAAAVESFRRGTQLVEAGKLQDAVDAFRDALQREPASVGARLDLADCYEKIGAPASAWREYVIAAEYARKASDARERVARSSAAGLEPRLLLVRLAGPPPRAMELQVDGEPAAPEIVARGSFALAPGRHHVELAAPGKRPISTDVAGGAGETRAITVAFEAEVAAAPARADTLPSPRSSAQRNWGLVLGGVGVAGVAVGSAFGAVAIAKRSTLESESTDASIGSTRFYSDRSNADTMAAVSTAAFIAGGVALAAGIALIATAPRTPTSASITLGPSLGGLVAVGRF